MFSEAAAVAIDSVVVLARFFRRTGTNAGGGFTFAAMCLAHIARWASSICEFDAVIVDFDEPLCAIGWFLHVVALEIHRQLPRRTYLKSEVVTAGAANYNIMPTVSKVIAQPTSFLATFAQNIIVAIWTYIVQYSSRFGTFIVLLSAVAIEAIIVAGTNWLHVITVTMGARTLVHTKLRFIIVGTTERWI